MHLNHDILGTKEKDRDAGRGSEPCDGMFKEGLLHTCSVYQRQSVLTLADPVTWSYSTIPTPSPTYPLPIISITT